MKKLIKKIVLVSGIAILGLMGAKYSLDKSSDEDATAKIEYARNALAEVEAELQSDTLNPEERHQLIQTKSEIQKEIDSYAAKVKGIKDNGRNQKQLQQDLTYARNVLAQVEAELKSDTLNPEQRHELILTRTAIQQEIAEYSRQLSGDKGNKAIFGRPEREK